MSKGCATLGDSMSMFEVDVYDAKGNFIQTKNVSQNANEKTINDWIITTRNRAGEIPIGYMSAKGNDFQNTNYIYIVNDKSQLPHPRGTVVTTKNITEICVYVAVRHCIEATWLNDRDQFLYPNDGWREDKDFQSDCLAYTLFHGQNRITAGDVDGSSARNNSPYKLEGVRGRLLQSTAGEPPASQVNHWIPFTEQEVDAPDNFQSHFMSDFIAGKIVVNDSNCSQPDLFSQDSAETSRAIACYGSTSGQSIRFTPAAQAVMDAGKALWYYYLHHKSEIYGAAPVDVNASFYDIRVYFQGRDEKGRMNSDSKDEEYMRLLRDLRSKQKTLASQIAEKVYKYGFLK